jgi:hypothetical protein
MNHSVARRLLLTRRPAYVRAFIAMVKGEQVTAAEQRLLQLAKDASGGYPIPAAFDPPMRGES